MNTATLGLLCSLSCLSPLSFKERIFFLTFSESQMDPKPLFKAEEDAVYALCHSEVETVVAAVIDKSRTVSSVPLYTALKQENLLLLQDFCGYFLVI